MKIKENLEKIYEGRVLFNAETDKIQIGRVVDFVVNQPRLDRMSRHLKKHKI